MSVVERGYLDGAAQFAEQPADSGSEDDEASDGDDGNEGDDETVFDQTLCTIARNKRGQRGKHWNGLSLWEGWSDAFRRLRQ